jgi:hypothetical protein
MLYEYLKVDDASIPISTNPRGRFEGVFGVFAYILYGVLSSISYNKNMSFLYNLVILKGFINMEE